MENEFDKTSIGQVLRKKFFDHILNWDVKWFKYKTDENEALSIMDNIKMTPGLLQYSNVDEYQSVMFPQLIHEYYSTLQRGYQELHEKKTLRDVGVRLSLHALSSYEIETNYCLIGAYRFRDNKSSCTHPRQGDLVIIFLDNEEYFAYVQDKVVVQRGETFDVRLTLLLGTSSEKDRFVGLSRTNIISVLFLEVFLAMIDALSNLETFSLHKLILSPDVEHYRLPAQLNLNKFDVPTKPELNSSQLKVISGLIEAIEKKEAKICLVQGPPGTGKSKTIVHLITSMLKRNNNVQFLVCSASNKAVDSLALQLMEIQRTLDRDLLFQVVRIGIEEKMDEAVKQISLKTLAARESKYVFGDLVLQPEFTILTNSQVICSTVMSSYTNYYMRQCFRDGSSSKRLVCIIDEAAQCNELLTMTPLVLGVDFLFLFGDQKQLEPIVFSQKAKLYGFNSSLFSRVEKIFKNNQSPIAMLDTQYRMVKPISSWPNKYFYNNCIKDAASVNPLGICNYLLFDHKYSQKKDGHANVKEAKLIKELIFFLKNKFNSRKNNEITIGVITPYQEQRRILQELINKKEKNLSKISPPKVSRKHDYSIHDDPNNFFEKVHKANVELLSDSFTILKVCNLSNESSECKKAICIDVNTVDSFQGSERDIIIISCVRSHGLGFTVNPSRLNVSMTRAKHTVIMFGNFSEFRKNSMWLDLLEDATERNVLIPIDDSNLDSVFNKYVNVFEEVVDINI